MGVMKTSWDWLADVLRQARADIAPNVSREQFAKARGGSARIMADLETAARTNYDRQTLVNAETWYGLAPGQIERLLQAAGELAEYEGQLATTEELWNAASKKGAPQKDRDDLNRRVAELRMAVQDQIRVIKVIAAERRRSDRETVAPAREDASHVLLDLPDEALEGLDEIEREEVRTAARLAALRKAREIRAGGQRGLLTLE